MYRIAPLFRAVRIATAVMLLLISTAAHAAPITYKFSGTTERINDITLRSVDLPGGSPFSGTFTYDPQTPLMDLSPLKEIFGDMGDDPTTRVYGASPLAPPLPREVLSATMNVEGAPPFENRSPAGGSITIGNDVIYGWPATTFSDTFTLSVMDANEHWVEIQLVDPTGQALAGTALPLTLDLAKFSQTLVEYQTEAGLVAGHITSLEATPVPEPSPLTVFALGSLALAGVRRRARGWRSIRLMDVRVRGKGGILLYPISFENPSFLVGWLWFACEPRTFAVWNRGSQANHSHPSETRKLRFSKWFGFIDLQVVRFLSGNGSFEPAQSARINFGQSPSSRR